MGAVPRDRRQYRQTSASDHCSQQSRVHTRPPHHIRSHPSLLPSQQPPRLSFSTVASIGPARLLGSPFLIHVRMAPPSPASFHYVPTCSVSVESRYCTSRDRSRAAPALCIILICTFLLRAFQLAGLDEGLEHATHGVPTCPNTKSVPQPSPRSVAAWKARLRRRPPSASPRRCAP